MLTVPDRVLCWARAHQPEPDEELLLLGTTRYGTVHISAWRHVHFKIHGDRTYFADWDSDLPITKGNLVRVQVERLPAGRPPHRTLWLWHAGPTTLAIDEICPPGPPRGGARRAPEGWSWSAWTARQVSRPPLRAISCEISSG
ncbi:hypothetical protein OHR68_20225 [Spirillospora sp. NBC_00431]